MTAGYWHLGIIRHVMWLLCLTEHFIFSCRLVGTQSIFSPINLVFFFVNQRIKKNCFSFSFEKSCAFLGPNFN